jgi:hypothetical protein
LCDSLARFPSGFGQVMLGSAAQLPWHEMSAAGLVNKVQQYGTYAMSDARFCTQCAGRPHHMLCNAQC